MVHAAMGKTRAEVANVGSNGPPPHRLNDVFDCRSCYYYCYFCDLENRWVSLIAVAKAVAAMTFHDDPCIQNLNESENLNWGDKV